MPKRETAPIGAPVWIDLFTADPDKSRAFYGELLGWTPSEPNEEFGGYFNFSKGDSLDGRIAMLADTTGAQFRLVAS